MALSKDTITQIESLLKLKPGALTTAITAEAETALEIPEVQTFTAAELATRDTATGNKKYNEGKEAGVEMFIKGQKTALGLEFDGKDGTAFLDAFKAKVIADANIKPAEHEKTIEKLRQSVKDQEARAAQLEGSINQIRLTSKVLADMPDNGLGLPKEDLLPLLERRGYSWEATDSGAVVVKKGGEILTDPKLQTPLAPKDAFGQIFKENKWEAKGEEQGRQGRGGSSSHASTGAPTTISEAQKAWESQGKNANTAEYSAYVNGLKKDNPSFDMAA
jgi:hypothetical protein